MEMVLDDIIKKSYNDELAEICSKKATLSNRIIFYTKVLKTENDLSNNKLEDFYILTFSKQQKKGIANYTQLRTIFHDPENRQLCYTCLAGRTETFNVKNPSDRLIKKMQERWVEFKDKHNIDIRDIKNKISLCDSVLTDLTNRLQF
jgi:hypothetical protein